jgi:hypothetical protein
MKDARILRIAARTRPYYAPTERMSNFELRCARMEKTADTKLGWRNQALDQIPLPAGQITCVRLPCHDSILLNAAAATKGHR